MAEQGTPKTLLEAVSNGRKHATIELFHSDTNRLIRDHVVDYLSQKFGAAMLEAHEDAAVVSALTGLWRRIKDGG